MPRVAHVHLGMAPDHEQEPLRILVTGSPWWADRPTLYDALWSTWVATACASGLPDLPPLVVIHGDAMGAAAMAANWTRAMRAAGYPASEEVHCPDFARLRESAEVLQNAAMVNAGAHLCLAFLFGESVTARDCMHRARLAGIRVVSYPSPRRRPLAPIGHQTWPPVGAAPAHAR